MKPIIRYGIEDKPKLGSFILYSLQWWAVSLPCVVIMGAVMARLHFTGLGDQVFYLQKLFALIGLATLGQIIFGHRLPLIAGPAVILLAGISASIGSGVDIIYSSILISSALLTLAALSGLLEHIRKFFTARIISVILILIALSICPTILRLILGEGGKESFHLLFSLGLTAAMIIANQMFSGAWKSLTILLGLIGGTLFYFILTNSPQLPSIPPPSESSFFLKSFQVDIGTISAFIFCILALTINELGSIESLGHMLKANNMKQRAKRGIVFLGLSNFLSGATGVIGPVSYSLSAGVISATDCASRWPFIPAALGLGLCCFSPNIVLICSLVPGPVMGALMLYLMSSQLGSGLSILVNERGVVDFHSGLTVGLPLMLALLISFAPASVFTDFPALIRPILSNGFVMGTILVILLENFLIKINK